MWQWNDELLVVVVVLSVVVGAACGKMSEESSGRGRYDRQEEFGCVRFDRQRHEGAGKEDDARLLDWEEGATKHEMMREREIPVSRSVCAKTAKHGLFP